MSDLVWPGLLFPLAGFIILLSTSSLIGRKTASWIGCTTVFASFVSFSTLLFLYVSRSAAPFEAHLFSWIPVEGIDAQITLLIDPLSLLMTLIVTGVGFLIHFYAAGYMEHEEDYARFFACMNFFIFAMLLLVLSGHLLVMFVGWEGVGLASYLLIGFWYHRPAAASAALKAFVVNRVGDLGFLLGLLLTFKTFGTGLVADVCEQTVANYPTGSPVITVITLLFFIGAAGKSAQIPLHVWLADAMEGPTPVSALIHAATMVTAGVFLLARFHCVYLVAPLTLQVIGIIGISTALLAAFSAIGQTDLKRVLAYSTVSQLGLMFLACSVGAFYAAMFHLTTHAFIKALLFLCAGNVVHMMNGTTNMEKMGGLSKLMPRTNVLFFLGILALSGIPPFAAFFSKDLILEQEHQAGHDVLFALGLVVSALTAFYLVRCYCLTFLGKPRLEQKILKVVKEAPWSMLAPICALALLAITGGLLGFSRHRAPILEVFLRQSDVTLHNHLASTGFHFTFDTALSIVCAFAGFAAAWFIYTRRQQVTGTPLLKNAFYIDELYDLCIVAPLRRLALVIADFVEPWIFNGSIMLSADMGNRSAAFLQTMQSGQIRSYIAWMLIGLLLVMLLMFF